MKRLNYGLALAEDGTYQVINTYYSPGIRDEWSSIRNESFLFLVVPSEWIDSHLLTQDGIDYKLSREFVMEVFHRKLRDLILKYFDMI